MNSSVLESCIAVDERTVAYSRTPEENIACLKKAFAGSPDNLFVRGSFVRGDIPFDDIDISAYNPGGRYKQEDRPQGFMGIPIVYGGIPLEQLENYFETCLRGTSSLMETIELSALDPTPGRIITQQKQKVIAERTPEYLLFLQMEEKISGRQFKTYRTAYYDRKRERGSKRTISRMLWTLKSLYPYLYQTSNTKTIMRELQEKRILPEAVVSDSTRVFELLSRNIVDPTEWRERTQRIDSWTQGILQPAVRKYVGYHLPKTFLDAADITLDPTSEKTSLQRTLGMADTESQRHRQWLLLFALSANTSLSQDGLLHIWNTRKDDFAYKNVIHNLLRNPAFPLHIVLQQDIDETSYAFQALKKRMQSSTS